MAGKEVQYVANWRIDSVGGKVLEAGDVITLESDKAKALVDAGALSRKAKADSDEK